MNHTPAQWHYHWPRLWQLASQLVYDPQKNTRVYWYIYTMEYYSAMKKNEMMPFAATRMELEIIILSEVSQTKTNITWYCLCIFNTQKTAGFKLNHKTDNVKYMHWYWKVFTIYSSMGKNLITNYVVRSYYFKINQCMCKV